MNNLYCMIALLTVRIHTRGPRAVIFPRRESHYSEMLFIVTGKMPSISNGSGISVSRFLRHFCSSRLPPPGSLIIIIRNVKRPACSSRRRHCVSTPLVLCFSRDADHEIPPDKLIYFSRAFFALSEIYGLMYGDIRNAPPFKGYLAALTGIIMLAKFLPRLSGHGTLPPLIIHVTNKLKSCPTRSQTCGEESA